MTRSVRFLMTLAIVGALGISSAMLAQSTPGVLIGRVIAFGKDYLDVQRDKQTLRIYTSADTKIWRENRDVGLSSIRVGDDVDILYARKSDRQIATAITANAERVVGIITKEAGKRFEVLTNPGTAQPTGYSQKHVTVLIGKDTEFAGSRPLDLKVGRDVEVMGYRLK